MAFFHDHAHEMSVLPVQLQRIGKAGVYLRITGEPVEKVP